MHICCYLVYRDRGRMLIAVAPWVAVLLSRNCLLLVRINSILNNIQSTVISRVCARHTCTPYIVHVCHVYARELVDQASYDSNAPLVKWNHELDQGLREFLLKFYACACTIRIIWAAWVSIRLTHTSFRKLMRHWCAIDIAIDIRILSRIKQSRKQGKPSVLISETTSLIYMSTSFLNNAGV